MEKIKIGFALCGSFCTFEETVPQIEALVAEGYDLTPIMSSNAYKTDSRFGKAEDFIWQIEDACCKKVLHSINEIEPIGPKKMFDALIIAPCTGNTLAKIAAGISDTAVTLACKSHLRNARPVIIGISTNDALGGNAENIGKLLNRKSIYFVPFRQDDPDNKPRSMISNMRLISKTLSLALDGRQLQPIILGT